MHQYFTAGIIVITIIVTLNMHYHENETILTQKAVKHVYKYQLIETLTQCYLMVIMAEHHHPHRYGSRRKRLSYTVSYKLQVLHYAMEHGNRAAARAFRPPPTEKIIRVWRHHRNEDSILARS